MFLLNTLLTYFHFVLHRKQKDVSFQRFSSPHHFSGVRPYELSLYKPRISVPFSCSEDKKHVPTFSRLTVLATAFIRHINSERTSLHDARKQRLHLHIMWFTSNLTLRITICHNFRYYLLELCFTHRHLGRQAYHMNKHSAIGVF